jgi:hypothetical protein
VELHRLGATWIRAVRCTTVELAPVPVIEVVVEAGAAREHRERFTVSVDGERVLDEFVVVEHESTHRRRLALPGAGLWSLEDPVLHLLEARTE